MTNHVRIKSLTGNIVLPKSSGQVRLFHSPRRGGAGHGEVFLDKAATTGPTCSKGTVKRVGAPKFMSAIPGSKAEIVGRFIEQTFDIEEGEVIKIFANVRPGYGHRPKQGNIFLRVRSQAAHRKLRIRLTDSTSAAYQFAEVEGTFDILDLDDLDAIGVVIPPQYRASASPANRDRVLSESLVIQPEVEAAVRLIKEETTDSRTGETIIRFKRKRRRAIRL